MVEHSDYCEVGTSTSYNVGSTVGAVHQVSHTGNTITASFTDWSSIDSGAFIILGKAKGGALGNYTAVANGDTLGTIRFAGADGTDLETIGAAISAQVDGTPGANDMPGRLVFSTTADGASSPTERMRITSDGKVKITGTPYAVLWFDSSYNNYKAAIVSEDITNYGRKKMYFVARTSEDSSDLNLATDTYLFAGTSNELCFPKIGTTASAANAFLNSASSPANQILRSTSSLRYKTNIEGIEENRSAAILNFRPVWYRSTAEADRGDWSWYGLIAEEVAKIEPRLVHWTYTDDAYEEVGNQRQIKPDAEMVPDGVQYDRLTVLLLDVVKRQQQAIETLESKVAALESA